MAFGNALREFFGPEYAREPEGWLSPTHLIFITCLVGLAVALAIVLGRRYRNVEEKQKLRVLKYAAILMDGLELFKIIVYMIRDHDWTTVLSNLPLFLCSVNLIALPIAAFGKGKIRDGALDFALIFGMFGCLLGTYLGTNIYGEAPIFSFHPMVSATTHAISGFSSVYIGVSGLRRMKKSSIRIALLILGCFMAAALLANAAMWNTYWEHNYMFISNDAGTPLSIVTGIVGGNQIFYTLFVVALYYLYMLMFYLADRLLHIPKKNGQ